MMRPFSAETEHIAHLFIKCPTNMPYPDCTTSPIQPWPYLYVLGSILYIIPNRGTFLAALENV